MLMGGFGEIGSRSSGAWRRTIVSYVDRVDRGGVILLSLRSIFRLTLILALLLLGLKFLGFLPYMPLDCDERSESPKGLG